MIEARDFFEAARQRRFHWYAGVPCSYLTPFINYVLQDPSLRYLSMANEGDAVALIAGVTLAGGAGPPAVSSSVSPTVSSAVSSAVPLHGRGVSMMQISMVQSGLQMSSAIAQFPLLKPSSITERTVAVRSRMAPDAHR